MLKKSDLARQFELVVKQEIKNYQDSLNFVLQSINELKDEIKLAKSESLDRYATIHSQQNDLTIQLQLIQKAQSETEKNIGNHGYDLKTFKEKATGEIGMACDASMSNSRKNEANQNTIRDVRVSVETLEDEIKGHSLTISKSFDNIHFKLSKDLKKMKEEILSIPSEAKQVREDLIELISCHKVDVRGIMREIVVYKKEALIIQKKIENIYTLIERLQGRLNESSSNS